MFKWVLFFIFLGTSHMTEGQSWMPKHQEPNQDSLKKQSFFKQLGNGFIPTKYVNLDLRYLLKFNQYEGVRTGVGGETNKRFSENYQLQSYVVYGFRDHRFKYHIASRFRVAKKTDTWLTVSYTDDLQETGSTTFLTDKRIFQFFEPRLLNIDLFHKHITKAVLFEHQLRPALCGAIEWGISKIDPTYGYRFHLKGRTHENFNIASGKIALQWHPFDTAITSEDTKVRGPKFTIQYTKSFRNLAKGDFNFSKLDLKALYKIGKKNHPFSELTIVSGIAKGDIPLTHLYHAYPNNITKENILERFSVAGLNSFETMYFNEFFSDKFFTAHFKYFVKPFAFSERFKPQLIFISRYAIGDIDRPERHESISFSSLKKGYTESGFELNKLFFGFGLSFTYRYGAYHLPEFKDNVALKFTFNISL